MLRKLLENRRYIQIAFNHTSYDVRRILPQIPFDPRILIEAGTPYIKREGMSGVNLIRRMWRGFIVADLKTIDGAYEEVAFARNAGANAVTAAGSAPTDTLDFFCKSCKELSMYSMIDMLGVVNPLRKLIPMTNKPDAVVIHKGRDEEQNPRSIIRYKDINKVRSKHNVFISVAGGLNENSVRKAYFNGADIAILNIVKSTDANIGLVDSLAIEYKIHDILQEIGT